MKKLSQRVISIIISILILASSLSCTIGVFADTQQINYNSDNLLEGLIPSAFAPTVQGQIWYKWGMIRTKNADTDKIWGYDLLQPDHVGAYNDDTIAYLTPLTDGKTDKSLWIQPENAWDLNDSSKYDDMYIVYELGEKANLSGFKFTMEAGGVSSTKTIDVYAAGTYADLYKNKVTTVTTDEQNIVGTLSTKDTKFIAFVLKTPGYSVSEISVYTEDIAVEPEITFTNPDVLEGKLPVAFAPTNSGAIVYNWSKVRTENSNNNTLWTYDLARNEHVVQYEMCASHLAKLTDNNVDTNIWVQPEFCSVGTRYDDIYIIYELDAVTDLEGFAINTSSNSSKTADVYAAATYAELFNNKLGTFITNKADIKKLITAEDIKYVAFLLKTPGYSVSEIKIHGTAAAQQEVTFTSENAIKGKMPIVYSSANSGGYSYNWTEARTNPDNNNPGLKWGYSVPINEPQGEVAQQATIESWKPYISDLTDENISSGQWVQPGRTSNPYDDFVIVYQLDELKTLEGFKFDSICKDVRVKVYAAKTYNTLFSGRSLIAELNIDEYIGSVSKKVDCAAEYVALVFDKPAFFLNEFSVYAKDYVKPDYGTNLIAGKNPMSIFVSNREYPIGANGARLWASDADTGRTNDMAVVSETMGWFTDDDFTKHKDWLHDGAQKYVNNKSYYKVLAYDFGSVSTLNKILVDSNLGGFDIYVSEDFNDLYKPESRVYTSNGDQLLPNGELDPATDLEAGEELIDVAGVTGRYIAIVITRANRQGVECYDAIAIREIQVYGTEGTPYVGDNLIKGKTPIFIHRVDYGAYDVPLEEYSVREGGPETYTDGKYSGAGYVQFPNSGGTLTYQNGGLALIYYLEGTCDVGAFAMHSSYYYAPGGIDVYVSEKFDTLFDDESCVFTSGGETAEDGVFDRSKNLGSRELSITLDTPKRGRYVAFVITRIYDIGIIGASGIMRLSELELFGEQFNTEQLPTTTVYDNASGASATFNYQNPDDTFIFADKGIVSFRLAKVDASKYATDAFKAAMLQNRFKANGDAFTIEFLDKNNKVIDVSMLEGENITFTFTHKNDNLIRLGEIRNGSIYVIREAQQYDDETVFRTDEFSKYLYMFLTPLEGNDLKYNGIVIENEDETTANGNNGAATGTDIGTSGTTAGNTANNNQQTATDSKDNATEGDSASTDKKPTSNRQWVVVDVDDPLEWFWNIYDTFAANIWMLILCIVVLVLCIGGIVAQIIIYKKRRNN